MRKSTRRCAPHENARQQPKTIRASARALAAKMAKAARALAAAAIVALGIAAAPGAAYGNTGGVKIDEVPESEFEPIGYEASFDFDDMEIIDGFKAVDDVGIYFDHRLSDGDNPSLDDLYLQVKGHPGLAFAIDESTPKGTAALRYTNGIYKGEAFDAIVTLEDWSYFEPDCGWENYAPYYEGHEVFQPGVYISTHWKSLSDSEQGYQNFNFYTVGLSDLKISVQFVRAGTDDPIEVKGHATCIDLDTTQAFEFGGCIAGGRIVEGNDVLYLENDGTRVCSEHVYLSTDGWKHPDEYKRGLVETFYDTTGENIDTPAEFHFFPGWRESAFENDGWPDPQSFFALTPDFLTAPNPDENPDGQTEVVKTADKTEGVTLGDEVEYTVDFKAHEQGVNCRVGYRYSALEIVDALPTEMTYVDGSGYLENENGERIEGAGTVIASEAPTEDATDDGQASENGGTTPEASGNEAFGNATSAEQNEEGDPNPPATQDGNEDESAQGAPDDTTAAPANAVRFVFDEEYLANMPMKGEHYRFVFKAKLAHYPADGSAFVRNSSYALINAKGKTPSNDVDTGIVKPALAIEKASDKTTYRQDETARYTLTVSQTEEGLTAENIVVRDEMATPGIGEIVEGSVALARPDGEEAQAEPAYLRDDEGGVVGFELETNANLAFGETMTITYDVLMRTPASTLENEAAASADNAQEAADDNVVEIAAPAAEPADEPVIELTKDADAEEAAVGDVVTYRIVAAITQSGATNVVISDDSLPEGMPIDPESITARVNGEALPDFEPALEGNGFSARFTSLNDGDLVEITYSAQVKDENLVGTTVVNTAVLTADELEKPLSDEASVDVSPASQDAVPPAADAPDSPASTGGPAPAGKFVKTGDAINAYLPWVLAVAGIAVAALVVAAAKRKRAEHENAQNHAAALARATEYGTARNEHTR
ncbi:MAG: isopeptide-forming domain-containing fimbrial protein [Slackia sp.]|nr:isopeptide-forming domain-containing fimbrial protein [Slackia sp.]